ncbi:MAG TPA: hypothetical protein VF753_01575 [Terriglobales bacterium]
MVATTGELIRLMNYVDDVDTTLRRITASVPMMNDDERKRLADRLRQANTNVTTLLSQLDKGAQ